ncbi:hypothetical protein J437_LFUL015423 [Ladona fulva]|uniref:PH domain-containing protein n=1 Tax=Ladona fulva TaxID=123851 RepID=A0A8K0KHA4_LADFU|nr:hypothetical protein J437_LFUL015423 [Ladona fulva]
MMRGVRRGCVRLKGAVIGIDDEDASTFTVTVDGKTFHFQAKHPEERERWIRAMEDTILRHAPHYHHRNQNQRHNSTPPQSYSHPYHSARKEVEVTAPTIQDFDKKVVEADTFLQILIDQVQALESRIEKLESPEEKQKLVAIYDIANVGDMNDESNQTNLSENINAGVIISGVQTGIEVGAECIEGAASVPQMMSREFYNTAHPVNGIYQAAAPSISMSNQPSQDFVPSISSMSITGENGNSATGDSAGVRITDLGRLKQPPGLMENSKDQLLSHLQPAPGVGFGIPETSYSSSEGEEDEDDDFYDADDYGSVSSPT